MFRLIKLALENALSPEFWLNAEEMVRCLDTQIEDSNRTLNASMCYQKELEHEIRISRVEDEDLFTCYVSVSVRIGDFQKKLENLYQKRTEFMALIAARDEAKKNLR